MSINILLISQARFASTRLPGKVLKVVGGKTLLEIHLQRLLQCKRVNKIIVATTNEAEATEIASIALNCGVGCFKGSMDDVLDRYYQAAKEESPGWVVRVTSDCPLIDPILVDKVIDFAMNQNADYCSNTLIESFPDGQDVEVFRYRALEKAWQDAVLQSDREHVTPYIKKNSDFYKKTLFTSIAYDEQLGLGNIRMTVDEKSDLEVVKILVSQLGIHASMKDYVDFIKDNKFIQQIHSRIIRNEGYLKSLKHDQEF